MKLPTLARALLLALPLAACTSDRPQAAPEAIPEAKTEAAIETHLPEVRYYVIADT
ncbi:MAG: hypothetical protein ACI8QZ_003675 [Chlamydiales bacterium]|jgi:hypothetical protein